MPITTDPAHRAEGLLYLDPNLKGLPSTHVLLVGVGRFDRPANPQISQLAPLSSPPASARAMADWFLNGLPGYQRSQPDQPRFQNPDRPLAILALLLSEGGGPANFAEGPVPEATHANVKTALKAWVNRARENNDNTSILLLCSHGQAFLKQTALLLQDYGSDPDSAVAGMTEIEQLVDALSTFPPRDKLILVDCCRLPTDLNLISGSSFGTPLLDQRALPPGTLPDMPQVLRSTRLGTAAYGSGDGQPTLFSGAVIEGLKGAAADPRSNWEINVIELAAAVTKILTFWRENGEPVQLPQSELVGDLRAITTVDESATASVFLALPEGLDPSTAHVRARREDDPASLLAEVTGTMNGEPFIRLSLPELVRCRLSAHDANGALIGETVITPRKPWMPSRLSPGTSPGGGAGGKVQVTRAKSADADAVGGVLTVSAEWLNGMPQTPVIRMVQVGQDPVPPPPPDLDPPSAPFNDQIMHDAVGFGAADGGQARTGSQGTAGGLVLGRLILERKPLPPVAVPSHSRTVKIVPGQWIIRASRTGLPDNETLVDVADGDEVTLDLPAPRSGHEWLAPAVMAGVVEAGERGTDQGLFPMAVPLLLGPDGAAVTDVTLSPGPCDSRFAVYSAEDKTAERFAAGQDGPSNRPVWAEFTGPGWRERCFVPVQGTLAAHAFTGPDNQHDPWIAEVLHDAAAPPDRSHVAGYAWSGRWSALLAFLARRSFLDAGATLRGIAADIPLHEAVMGKVANPLAALAAAQIAVATGETKALDIRDDWLANLAAWFPTLPDGAVIQGRHLLRQGQVDAATLAFAQAHARGVPVYSLCVDWLSQGMIATGHLQAAQARARALVTDPTRAFTVFRLAEGQA